MSKISAVVRESLTGSWVLSRSEAPNATEYRFEFREDTPAFPPRRIFNFIMSGDQFAASLTSRVVSDVRAEIRRPVVVPEHPGVDAQLLLDTRTLLCRLRENPELGSQQLDILGMLDRLDNAIGLVKP